MNSAIVGVDEKPKSRRSAVGRAYRGFRLSPKAHHLGRDREQPAAARGQRHRVALPDDQLIIQVHA